MLKQGQDTLSLHLRPILESEAYRARVSQLEKEGRSSAQAREVADAEFLKRLEGAPDAGSEPLDDGELLRKVSEAGELLIRAAAVLGTLPTHEQRVLQQMTDGGLPDGIAFALRAAAKISPQVKESLQTHPPIGLVSVAF
mgnify:CR=1 FL=1